MIYQVLSLIVYGKMMLIFLKKRYIYQTNFALARVISIKLMVKAIFDIMKDEDLLQQYVIPELTIDKETVEKTIFEICALNSDQYEVNYLDEENDPILAEGEEDYLIARDQIQGNSIVFTISIKGQEKDIKFTNKFREQNDESECQEQDKEKEQEQFQEMMMEDMDDMEQFKKQTDKNEEKNDLLNGPQKRVYIYEKKGTIIQVEDQIFVQPEKESPREEVSHSEVNQEVKKKESVVQVNYDKKEEKLLEKREQNPINEVEDKIQSQVKVSQPDHVRQLSEDSEKVESCFTDKSQKLVSSMSQKLLEVSEKIEELQPESVLEKQFEVRAIKQTDKGSEQKQSELKLLQNGEVLENIYSTILKKLRKELKPSCFNNIQEVSLVEDESVTFEFTCEICRISKKEVPFYISQGNQRICCKCQPNYAPEQLLVKVRSSKQANELHEVAIVPSYKKEFSDLLKRNVIK